MAGVTTYNAKDVIVVMGAHQVHGFSDDTMVTIAPHGDGFSLYVGAQGEVARNVDQDETCEITFSLAQTSSSNDFLSALHLADKKIGKGMVPLAIKDLSGTTTFYAAQAWVTQLPEKSMGKEVTNVDWTINTGKATTFLGGNN